MCTITRKQETADSSSWTLTHTGTSYSGVCERCVCVVGGEFSEHIPGSFSYPFPGSSSALAGRHTSASMLADSIKLSPNSPAVLFMYGAILEQAESYHQGLSLKHSGRGQVANGPPKGKDEKKMGNTQVTWKYISVLAHSCKLKE